MQEKRDAYEILIIPLRLFVLICFKLIIAKDITWSNIRLKNADFYNVRDKKYIEMSKDKYQSYEIARHAYEDSLFRYKSICEKIMSTSQVHGIVFAAISLIHANISLSTFSIIGIVFNFASIFIAVYSLGIKSEFTFEYGMFNNTKKSLSDSVRQQFEKVIGKKNDTSDYLADAYRIITLFLCISLFFVFIDLLPIRLLKENDSLISSGLILLWVAYKFIHMSFLAKIIENMTDKS